MNVEYENFIEKFKPKKTTDDCYTPPNIYEAVCKYVEIEYGLNRENFKRPFKPGGDYQNETYSKTDVIVDNPPFSIMAEILKFYTSKNIKFFLFAPTLTLFSSAQIDNCCIPVGISITYENGAVVDTSFITNIETDYSIKTAPLLYEFVKEADLINKQKDKKELPKYNYPDNIILSTKVAGLNKYGIDFKVPKKQCAKIRQLDSQKPKGKTIFGSGYIVSDYVKAEKEKAEKEKAEKEKAEIWELSSKEKEIINYLNSFSGVFND